jgi:glycerol-3-phosphate dehydrogenase subunit C
MGFKEASHESSIRLSAPLMKKIREMDPEILATDCLSCRLQFEQLADYEVRHPIEILWDAVSDPIE